MVSPIPRRRPATLAPTTTDPAATERMAGGVYHTGDLAYTDNDGFIYFAGRLGDWMRVDGENLGTAPIEQVLWCTRFPTLPSAIR